MELKERLLLQLGWRDIPSAVLVMRHVLPIFGLVVKAKFRRSFESDFMGFLNTVFCSEDYSNRPRQQPFIATSYQVPVQERVNMAHDIVAIHTDVKQRLVH